jgi:hypothetical protein
MWCCLLVIWWEQWVFVLQWSLLGLSTQVWNRESFFVDDYFQLYNIICILLYLLKKWKVISSLSTTKLRGSFGVCEPAYYSFVHSVWPKKKFLLLTTSRWKNVSPVTNANCSPSSPLELLLLGGCLFEIKSLISSIFAYSTFYTKKRKHQLEAKHLCREKPSLRTVVLIITWNI